MLNKIKAIYQNFSSELTQHPSVWQKKRRERENSLIKKIEGQDKNLHKGLLFAQEMFPTSMGENVLKCAISTYIPQTLLMLFFLLLYTHSTTPNSWGFLILPTLRCYYMILLKQNI